MLESEENTRDLYCGFTGFEVRGSKVLEFKTCGSMRVCRSSGQAARQPNGNILKSIILLYFPSFIWNHGACLGGVDSDIVMPAGFRKSAWPFRIDICLLSKVKINL